MKLNFKTKLLLFVLFLGLVTAGVFWYVNLQKTPKGVLILHGRVEGKETNLGTKVQGRIIKLYKREGDPVKRGELLAELRPDEYFAQLQSAQSEVRSAEQTVLMAESYFIKSKSKVEQAQRDLERYKKLYNEGLVSKRDLELTELEYTSALADLKVNQKYINQAKAKYLSALQKVKEIEIAYKETKIYAPSDGVILSRVVEEGEVVNPGQVLYTMVNLQNLYIKVYIPEPQLGKVKLGQPARVYVDAYPNKYFNGTLTRIYEQAEFTPKNVETKEERVKLVFGAEVAVENPEGILKPGMPADVVIKIDPQAEWIKP
ncbi:efflux RND transporter periplasmic adaptor subunit [Thermodesulfobacterium sp. TA1]|uniref:HlyD family secretion protein n=1 Tax=Thermodesulfobacterium sp. TA1 TaxID=2234087 RepID=UPI001232727D|nr:efflux RND transporter periplasmic adaptor subunit [Thermodesulfobacterium sp. TA1]QER41237.1 efflux RND transporter periplasmic adaptor subunit [Thermodesulfobacterium sp. TA1]